MWQKCYRILNKLITKRQVLQYQYLSNLYLSIRPFLFYSLHIHPSIKSYRSLMSLPHIAYPPFIDPIIIPTTLFHSLSPFPFNRSITLNNPLSLLPFLALHPPFSNVPPPPPSSLSKSKSKSKSGSRSKWETRLGKCMRICRSPGPRSAAQIYLHRGHPESPKGTEMRI